MPKIIFHFLLSSPFVYMVTNLIYSIFLKLTSLAHFNAEWVPSIRSLCLSILTTSHLFSMPTTLPHVFYVTHSTQYWMISVCLLYLFGLPYLVFQILHYKIPVSLFQGEKHDFFFLSLEPNVWSEGRNALYVACSSRTCAIYPQKHTKFSSLQSVKVHFSYLHSIHTISFGVYLEAMPYCYVLSSYLLAYLTFKAYLTSIY